MRAGIQLECLPRFRQLEDLCEFIWTEHHVRFAGTISGRDVLDGLAGENDLTRLRIGVSDLLVDVPFDVELAKDGAATRLVEAEHAKVFVRLAFRVLVLWRIDTLVLHADEPGVENASVLALHAGSARLTLR
jgi:hypothetical protein